MQSGWIVYKNKRILYANYSGLDADMERLKSEVGHINTLACQQPLGSVLLLVNVLGSTGTKDALGFLKDSAVLVKKHVIKTAVVGVSGFKEMLMNMISSYSGLSLVVFPDLESAKDWLIKDV